MLNPEFVKTIERFPGLDKVLENGTPEVSIRFNRAKNAGVVTPDPVPWSGGRGTYLSERPIFTLDPALHQGRYYVQEASSMFHGHVVAALTAAINSPLVVIDACAAPGGKTTAVIDALPAGSLMIANEYVPARASVLRENLIKWGYPATIVTRGDTASVAQLGPVADIIVADVPCSGEGMMRKDAEAVAQWSPALVGQCVARQREIVANLWDALKPGGFMIYSTCTFNRHENEEMVGYIIDELGGESVEVPGIDPAWGIAPGVDTAAYCYRFMPHLLRGEGLFVSVIRKPGEPGRERSKSRPVKGAKPVVVPAEVKKYVSGAAEMEWSMSPDGRINAFPSRWASLLQSAEKNLSVIHHGIVVGRTKGRDILPDQSLAMSTSLSPSAFPRVELDRDTALAYLRCGAISLPSDTPRGHVLVTHDDIPLGFVKNLGNRANNLYPKEWRILMKGN